MSLMGSGVRGTSNSCWLDPRPSYDAAGLTASLDRSLAGSEAQLFPESFDELPSLGVADGASTPGGNSRDRHPLSSSNDKLNSPHGHSERPTLFLLPHFTPSLSLRHFESASDVLDVGNPSATGSSAGPLLLVDSPSVVVLVSVAYRFSFNSTEFASLDSRIATCSRCRLRLSKLQTLIIAQTYCVHCTTGGGYELQYSDTHLSLWN